MSTNSRNDSVYENVTLKSDCQCDKPRFCKCDAKEDRIDRTLELLLFSIIVTVFFILVSLPSFDASLKPYIPYYYHRLVARALLFFLLVYLTELAIRKFRQNKNYCFYR
jgi:hypothetical protein